MKKIAKLVAVILVVCSMLSIFSACNSNKYKLTVEDPNEYLIEKLHKRYTAGEKVTVKTPIICDASLTVYLDGVAIDDVELIEIDGHYSHWEHYFVMPNHNAVLSFKMSDGFLPPEPTIDEEIKAAFIAKYPHDHLTNEDITLRYYGKFDGVYVLFIDVKVWEYPAAITRDVVAGVEFIYSSGQKMTIYSNGEFYSIPEAFEKDVISYDDLLTTQKNYRADHEYLYKGGETTPPSIDLDEAIRQEIIAAYIAQNPYIALEPNYEDKIGIIPYGIFDNTYVVVIQYGYTLDDVIKTETVYGVNFYFNGSLTFSVYHEGELCSLHDAFYNRGLLTHENLLTVRDNHREKYEWLYDAYDNEHQDYVLTISLEKQVYQLHKGILVDITLENRSGKDVEIAYYFLFYTESNTGELYAVAEIPMVTTKKLFKNGEIIHETSYSTISFPIGHHGLKYKAVFYLSWEMTEYGYEETYDRVEVWSNEVEFSVEE